MGTRKRSMANKEYQAKILECLKSGKTIEEVSDIMNIYACVVQEINNGTYATPVYGKYTKKPKSELPATDSLNVLKRLINLSEQHNDPK